MPAPRRGGGEFQGYIPFTRQPDPRHLDMCAMLADPFGQLMVKSFRPRVAVPVYVLADLSASMGFRGAIAKTDLLAEFAAAEIPAWPVNLTPLIPPTRHRDLSASLAPDALNETAGYVLFLSQLEDFLAIHQGVKLYRLETLKHLMADPAGVSVDESTPPPLIFAKARQHARRKSNQSRGLNGICPGSM